MRRLFIAASIVVLIRGEAQAQTAQAPVVMDESVVVVAAPRGSGSFETRHELSSDAVTALRAHDVAEVLRRLPSVHVPTNTRGESIAFLCNAHERQVGIFYDGAAINVPWDNRLDLRLVPSSLIGGIRVAAGPIAPHYGVNAVGVMNLLPREGGIYGRRELAFEGGEYGHLNGMVFIPFSLGAVDVSAGASYSESDGDSLSSAASDVYGQSDDNVRSNTDRRLASAFGRARFTFAGSDVAVSFFHVNGEQGIAPEPTAARFWRYPDVEHTVGVLSVRTSLGENTHLDGAAWAQHFGQTIDAYTTASYSTLRSRQIDEDRTFGLREIITHQFGAAKFVGSFSVLQSSHDQQDIAFSSGLPPATPPPELGFEQRNWSLGGELEFALVPDVIAEIGAGYDLVEYPETGDKPPREGFEGPAGRVGVVWVPSEKWRLRAAVGHKVRAPTMRELFGEALGRFLVNPNLEAERVTTFELAAEWRGRHGHVYVIPFHQILDNTIDQRNVGTLHQRINLRGSEVNGIELGGASDLMDFWTVRGSVTVSDVRRMPSSPTETLHLAEKPNVIADLTLSYEKPSGLSALLEMEHLGRAYSADTTGELVPLPTSIQMNMQVSYGFGLGHDVESEIYVRADNVTDELVEPQFGLPAPGRVVGAGIRLRW